MFDHTLAWGFHPDPYGIHQERYISVDGLPTELVRDGGIEKYDPPPEGTVHMATASPADRRWTAAAATWSGQGPAPQRFCHFGARFSANAFGPSLASSLPKTSPEISDSIL
jgi:hypothetical protein